VNDDRSCALVPQLDDIGNRTVALAESAAANFDDNGFDYTVPETARFRSGHLGTAHAFSVNAFELARAE
jgi:hypothetical protein